MDLNEIIRDLYQAFKDCDRPDHFTNYDHCPECKDHDETMRNANLESLNSEHLGSPGYNPFNFLTIEGFSHYMPKLMELAITGVKSKHGDLFLSDFLFYLAPDKDYDRFKNYNLEKISSILNALEYANIQFRLELETTLDDEDMDLAISYWKERLKEKISTY